MGKESQRIIYVPEADWDEVRTAAHEDRVSMAELVRRAIREFITARKSNGG